jgi:ferredoxin
VTSVTLHWTVEADRDRCIGSGTCAFAVPEVFDVDDSGRVVLIGSPEPGDDRVREAVEHCPTSALTLLEEGTP